MMEAVRASEMLVNFYQSTRKTVVFVFTTMRISNPAIFLFTNYNFFLLFSRFLNDTEIAKAQRDFELKKAAYDMEVQTKVGF
jgi:hypothetical protein